jgi:cytochrome c-type biogenesis protein CcmE
MAMNKKERLQFTLLILCALGLATAIALFALRKNVSYFFTPQQMQELRMMDDARVKDGAVFRLGGLVKPGSLEKTSGDLLIKFTVTDELRDQKVEYKGIAPDLFREGQGVVATGSLQNGVFVATVLLAKHDEKYTPPELAKEMKKLHGEKTGQPDDEKAGDPQ